MILQYIYEVAKLDKNHKIGKGNGSCQELWGGENEELLLTRYGMSVTQDKESYRDGWWS